MRTSYFKYTYKNSSKRNLRHEPHCNTRVSQLHNDLTKCHNLTKAHVYSIIGQVTLFSNLASPGTLRFLMVWLPLKGKRGTCRGESLIPYAG